ncbi:MAG: hypothetical protein BWX66_01817 [Deltaproteobacteria bacterium ADurb.Bin058]|jgi:hypothetical protein|nr:MAG: hypothetical protein BWX66_01817 [Deltaproteobacteria bacterium ADurb.Bin058]HPC91726.1 hypothetical protein [Myxococcota bacterium]
MYGGLDPNRRKRPIYPFVIRAIVLTALLVAIIVYQKEIGVGAANCMGVFGLR